MEQVFSEIVGTLVMADDVQPLTTVKNMVIDPENGKILAFVVDAYRNRIIAPIDVVEWRKGIMRVHNSEAIIDGDEILRVETVQESGIKLIGSKVESEDGFELGRVYDYTIDDKSLSLKNLDVAKGLIILFRYEKKIISWKDIIEILPEKIVVKSGLVKAEEVIELQGLEA